MGGGEMFLPGTRIQRKRHNCKSTLKLNTPLLFPDENLLFHLLMIQHLRSTYKFYCFFLIQKGQTRYDGYHVDCWKIQSTLQWVLFPWECLEFWPFFLFGLLLFGLFSSSLQNQRNNQFAVLLLTSFPHWLSVVGSF